MSVAVESSITLAMMRESLYSAVVCDALDSIGLNRQSPRIALPPLTVDAVLVGRCRTTLWADMAHSDPRPYKLELQAVDACEPDDVLIAAAGGSMRSGIWGELLSTAASSSGCVGSIIDGAVRDVGKMRAMKFPVFARGVSPYDSLDRQRVVDLGVCVEINGVTIHQGDLVIADVDGIVVVPRAAEEEVVRLAWKKVHAENITRDAIRAGMKATAAYEKYGVL
jgi:4-hydroxy-4-methyl-2-oxoglutarate aldolase